MRPSQGLPFDLAQGGSKPNMPRLPEWRYGDRTDDWSIADCVRILRRHKAALLWITCMGGLVAAVITGVQSRVYQSRALVEIRTFNENFLNLGNSYPTIASRVDDAQYVQTQAELLQQDSLIEEVARKLHLESRPEFQPSSTLLGNLREDIRVVPVRNTRIIEIVCDARDAFLAADLANTLARTFIEQGIETRQRGARETYESLQSQLDQLSQGLPRRGAGLPAREAGTNQYVYKSMLQEAHQARTASMIPQSNIELIAPAEPPARPYKPNLPLNLAIGILDGFVVALGFVMLREQNTPLSRAPGEAATFLALPELGAIPSAGAQTPSSLGFFTSNQGKLRVEKAVLEHRSSCLSESFRGTLTSILSGNGDHPRILVVTSSRPMEGKTTTVTNLGFALAEIGRKTLLIDADVRHPQLHGIFDQPSGRGLIDFHDQTDLSELPLDVLVNKTAVPHLYLLACAYTVATLGLQHSDRRSRLFRRFREEFDYVLVDTPPCLEFDGARDLARCADGLVLVVRADYTDLRTAQAAVERFEDDGTRVMGIILNRWNPFPCDMALPRFSRRAGQIGNLGHDLPRRV